MKALLKKLAPSFIYKAYCNICGSGFRQPFADYGIVPRRNARCYKCGSLERHRILWKFLSEETTFLKQQVYLLHIAPEGCLFTKLRMKKNIDYHAGDLSPEMYGEGVRKMDVTALPFADNTFDAVICNHVLEHIPDDIKAMQELYRVLKPGGMAIMMTPINTYKKPEEYDNSMTYEDPSITSAEERLRAFGQEDHVRVYGNDLKERLESVGFTYKEFTYIGKLNQKLLYRYGLQNGDPVQHGLK